MATNKNHGKRVRRRSGGLRSRPGLRRWIWVLSCLAVCAALTIGSVLIARGPVEPESSRIPGAAASTPGASAPGGAATTGPGATPSAGQSATSTATPTATASASSKPNTIHSTSPVSPIVGGGTYVQAGTQGYRGPASALTVYSAANKKVPSSDCEWNASFLYLRCDGTNLSISDAEIEGGLYWTGCGSLDISNSIVYLAPSTSWSDIYASCATGNSGATLSMSRTTVSTGPGNPTYTGGSDVGGLWTDSDRPMYVSNSLLEGFPQGLDPTGGSVIKDNEIYPASAQCNSGSCHSDGLFSQGGSNILYEGNRIVMPGDSVTAAVFYQADGSNVGNQVIGNYLDGGAYTVYNESATGVNVENNVFAGSIYGNDLLTGSASWGVWSGNIDLNGALVKP
jgi:hypothetical protein